MNIASSEAGSAPYSRKSAAKCAAVALAALSMAPAIAAPLDKYVLNLTYPGRVDAIDDARVALGAVPVTEPPLINRLIGSAGQYVDGPVDMLYRIASVRGVDGNQIAFYGTRAFPCRTDPFLIPAVPTAGVVLTDASEWRGPGPEYCGPNHFIGPPAVRWRFQDTVSFGDPVRRVAVDGGEYDAAPMVIRRNGVPWITYYWGYRLGLVGSRADWDPANLVRVPALGDWFNFPEAGEDFNLVRLPPPLPEDGVVEYVNRANFPVQPDGQFFYAALAADKAALDAQPGWSRTGRSFKSGGYVTVCRFYGGLNGGPNTHFYSSDAGECAMLRQVPQLSYEGQTFAVNAPLPARTPEQAVPGALRACPAESVPLFRLYNNASASGGRFVSNHRYTTDRADVAAFVQKGWLDEGHVMCVPQ